MKLVTAAVALTTDGSKMLTLNSVFIVASDGKEKSSLQRGCFFGYDGHAVGLR